MESGAKFNCNFVTICLFRYYISGELNGGGVIMPEERVSTKSSIAQVFMGVIVIALGLSIIFVPSLLENFWLLFIWVPGLIMEYNAIRGEKGLFVPGGVLLTVALALTLGVIFDGFYEGGGWALFILAPAVGLLQLYLAGGRKPKALLTPIFVLTIVAVISLIPSTLSKWAVIIVGALLIGFGVLILLKKK
jgi:hypothetical protein